MPTFDDPLRDAAEASAALRGLAHATRTLGDPADTYLVLGDVLAGVRSLRQVLDQLADVHVAAHDRAFTDEGDPLMGRAFAYAAADMLHDAGTLLDTVESRLDAASAHSGHIAWHPDAPKADAPAEHGPRSAEQAAPGRRWISVVFLQGAEADEVLDLIDSEGTDAAIDRLSGFDYGEETTQAALENGYVYAVPPVGSFDRMATRDGYALVHSPFSGYVSLLREFTTAPELAPEPTGVHPLVTVMLNRARSQRDPAPVSTQAAPAAQQVRPQAAGADWFARQPGAASSQRRGLAL
jgi:hypothetical protein